MELIEDPDQRLREHQEHDRRDPRREIDRAHRRQQPPEQPQVGFGDVVEKPLDPVQPGRIRQAEPAREDVREDHEHVDDRKDPDESLRRGDGVRKQAHLWAVRRAVGFSYAWLKKPPRSINRARSSAETSTFRGVSRNTLSAIRCIPPSSAYVRPLAKSISRFESSWSLCWRLRMTGTPSLKRSAICCASLKLRGSTRCTLTFGDARPSTPRNRRGASRC